MIEQSFGHHIQKDILKKLISMPSARYAELRPKNIESNLFMYHLKQLIRSGYVEKTNTGYELTSQGKHFADRASLSSLKLRIQPKLITILAVQHKDGRWVLLERLHQPFIHSVGLPSGKIHYGEALQDAADRELKEKTNMSDVPLVLRGTFIMRFRLNGEVVNHIIGYVFSGKTTDSYKDGYSQPLYRSFYGSEADLLDNTNSPRLKGHAELIKLMQDTPVGKLFFTELDFTSDY